MRTHILAIGLAALFSSSCLAAPSFDCSKARSVVEHAICASDDLAFLDKELARAYEAALKSGATSAEQQRSWLQRRDTQCKPVHAEECARESLWERLDELTADLPLPSGATVMIDGVEHFVRPLPDSKAQERLASLMGQLETADKLECSRLVEVPSGTENYAYGAECVVHRKNGSEDHAMICDSLMTNAFHYQYLGKRKISSKHLGFFASAYCAGG